MLESSVVPADEAAALVKRIEAIAERLVVPFGDPREPRYSCPDCLDRGWLVVPHLDPSGRCCECRLSPDHEVARACLSCENGVAKEAGIWYRFLYRGDRRGRPMVIDANVQKYEAAMKALGPSSKRVQLALDAIIEREKAEALRSEV